MGPTAARQGCGPTATRSMSGGFPEPGCEPGGKCRAPWGRLAPGPASPGAEGLRPTIRANNLPRPSRALSWPALPAPLTRQCNAWPDPQGTVTLSTMASPRLGPKTSLQPTARHCPTCQASLSLTIVLGCGGDGPIPQIGTLRPPAQGLPDSWCPGWALNSDVRGPRTALLVTPRCGSVNTMRAGREAQSRARGVPRVPARPRQPVEGPECSRSFWGCVRVTGWEG